MGRWTWTLSSLQPASPTLLWQAARDVSQSVQPPAWGGGLASFSAQPNASADRRTPAPSDVLRPWLTFCICQKTGSTGQGDAPGRAQPSAIQVPTTASPTRRRRTFGSDQALTGEHLHTRSSPRNCQVDAGRACRPPSRTGSPLTHQGHPCSHPSPPGATLPPSGGIPRDSP